MKLFAFVLATDLIGASASAQSFVNLNFESANHTGYAPGSQNVPISSLMPGWSGYFLTSSMTNQVTQIWYDVISLGGYAISVNDTNGGIGPIIPLQGKYSAYLFGGSGNVSAKISQTGLVPSGSKSITMDINTFYNFTVTLGGQTINMVPLQIFSNYTLYGGDISSFSGQLAELSITAPPTSVPNAVLLDDIQFSAQSIPEPHSLAMLGAGTLLLSFFRHSHRFRFR